jgi:hypothetical protein
MSIETSFFEVLITNLRDAPLTPRSFHWTQPGLKGAQGLLKYLFIEIINNARKSST